MSKNIEFQHAFTWLRSHMWANPALYFENNVAQTLALLDQLVESGVTLIVYSLTCAMYGNAGGHPIKEDHPQDPANPYGWSKLFAERMIETHATVYGLRHVMLRHFNEVGATSRHGERHDPEPHLIQRMLNAWLGAVPYASVFGDSYPTDGTAVRDYIHVGDLGSALLLALKHLREGGPGERINLGNSRGKQVIQTSEQVTGARFPTAGLIHVRETPLMLWPTLRKRTRVLAGNPASRICETSSGAHGNGGLLTFMDILRTMLPNPYSNGQHQLRTHDTIIQVRNASAA